MTLSGTDFISIGGSGSAPQNYTVPGSQVIDLLSAIATFDGTSAAGDFVPVFEVRSPGGSLMAQGKGATVTAGSSRTVTFAPFLDEPAATSPAASGALTLITKTVLSVNATFAFNAIPGTFNDLIVVGILRSTLAATVDTVVLNVNGDATGNYTWQYTRGNAVNITANGATSATSSQVGFVPGATGDANKFGNMELQLMGYADSTHSRYKGGVSVSGCHRAGASFPDVFTWEWDFQKTPAITSLTIQNSSGSTFLAGSECRLYGRT